MAYAHFQPFYESHSHLQMLIFDLFLKILGFCYNVALRFTAMQAWSVVLCVLMLLAAVIKMCCLPVYLRVYLSSVTDKTDSLLCQAGTISNSQYQKLVASHNYYACVACLQLAAPAVLLFFQTAMMAMSIDVAAEPPSMDLTNKMQFLKFVWKLVPAALCHNLVRAANFILCVVHCEITAFGLLLNFTS